MKLTPGLLSPIPTIIFGVIQPASAAAKALPGQPAWAADHSRPVPRPVQPGWDIGPRIKGIGITVEAVCRESYSNAQPPTHGRSSTRPTHIHTPWTQILQSPIPRPPCKE